MTLKEKTMYLYGQETVPKFDYMPLMERISILKLNRSRIADINCYEGQDHHIKQIDKAIELWEFELERERN